MRTIGIFSIVGTACGSGEVTYTRGVPDESDTDDTDADTDADADSGADTDAGKYEIAIGGNWVDSLGIGNRITDDSWTWTYPGHPDTIFDITQFENDPGLCIVHDTEPNDAGDKLWGRFDWTWVDGAPHYCHAVGEVADEDAAMSAPPPDREDLNSGCGGFEWWRLMPT